MKLKRDSEGGLQYMCPCGDNHRVTPGWTFNGDTEKPTFSPSVLVRAGHYAPGAKTESCWCSYTERTGKVAPFKCYLCHSFVVDGMVQFLSDCSHEFAGKTVPLPDWPRVVADGSSE